MGATRALVTVKYGTTYINDRDLAAAYLADLARCSQSVAESADDVDMSLVQDFKKRIKHIASEVGSQVGMTVATGIPLSSGGQAYRVARSSAPGVAEDIRRSSRASGTAKHDFSALAGMPVKNTFIHFGPNAADSRGTQSAPDRFDIGTPPGVSEPMCDADTDEDPLPSATSSPASPHGSPAPSRCPSPAGSAPGSPRCLPVAMHPLGFDAYLADKVTKISSTLLRLARSREALAAVRLQVQSQKCATGELIEIKAQLSQSEAGFTVIADDISEGLCALAAVDSPALHDFIETARIFIARPSGAHGSDLLEPLPSIPEDSDLLEPKKAKKKKEKKKTKFAL